MKSAKRRAVEAWRALAAVAAASAPLAAYATGECAHESAAAGSDRHFMILAGRDGVFYDRSGPAFVMLLRLDTEALESEVGAVGMYADDGGRPLFGPVPAERYNEFLREPAEPGDVMLRLELDEGQYRRVLGVLRAWDRRAREKALLYPEVAMNNILLVKQATEELNLCGDTLVMHDLDWGLEDDISEDNEPLAIPLEYFKELRRLNADRHVPDASMPPTLLVAEPHPLPPLPVSANEELATPAARAPATPHVHPPALEHTRHPPAEPTHHVPARSP